ncbi:NAD(P)H dehydrogenase [Vallitalea guaymasensis]|uniref:NAD(P)H dehydrogenase n=1 Tax=Vallitalea guaymasensis TaxID=1185412 RepID=UPI00272B66A9|nr:NAD(P)H dehydrogenase [Vallitalea guaymasensis]
MKTIILNGSPKGDKGNSEIFAKQFIKYMKHPLSIKYISKENPKQLAVYVKDYDSIIIILPLYVHAMPGIVMKFIECLEPAIADNKSIGFLIQAGFPEAAQEQYVERYFRVLAKELNYSYVGTVVRGAAAGTSMIPEFMSRKLFKLLNRLGIIYEKTNTFDKSISAKLAGPYKLKKSQLIFYEFLNKSGINNLGWHKFLRKNNALDKRLDRPFLT